MEISIPLNNDGLELVEHNIVDNTRAYYKGNGVDSSAERYNNGDKLQDADLVWEFIGDDFTPQPFSAGDVTGDIVYKNHYVVKCTSHGSHDVAKQPEAYSTVDNSPLYDTWTNRYTKLKTNITSPYFGFMNMIVGSSKHSLFKSANSSTEWYYRVSWEQTIYTWGEEIYDRPGGFYMLYTENYLTGEKKVRVYWGGTLVHESLVTSTPIAGWVFDGTDGKEYKIVGAKEAAIVSGEKYYYYSVAQRSSFVSTQYKYQEAKVTYESSLDIYEDTAVSFGTPSNERWTGRHFVMRNTDLYMRTQTEDTMQTVAVTDNQYQTIEALSEFYGFVEIGATNYLKPFDGKNYTNVTQQGDDEPVRYLIKSTEERFDTIAFSGLIAKDIEIIFRDENNNVVTHIGSYEPKTYRDKTVDGAGNAISRLAPYPTTAILYSTAYNIISAGGTIEILFKGGTINIGTIMLGLSVNAGFTHVEFQNKFNDWSPKEINKWGGVDYIEGIKQLVHKGTVDVPITNYDMMNRLMTSIGASTVILNGSGAKDNRIPNSEDNIFSSTMLIGRIKDFQLKTKLKNKKLDDMATYSFTIEEDI